MRWIWIDRILELTPGERMVAIKNVSLAEDHLHDHFPALDGHAATPVMPGSLIVEGMAQTAGILVGHARSFREKVILAKVNRVEIERDATPGETLRYTAELERIDEAGASTRGTVEIMNHATGETVATGRIDLIFSHVDQNRAGAEFPEENFVFTEGFATLLRCSGIEAPF